MVNESTRWQDPAPIDGATETVRATFDWTDTAPSTAVVEAVSIALDRDPTVIESLARRVDPDALDAVVAGEYGSGATRVRDDRLVSVSFTFADRSVTVHASGVVVVEPVDVG